MVFTMVVTLFTSRVILDKLGIDDYGIYQAVAGIVGLLSFVNGALSSGASRFLTYSLGEEDAEKTKDTFSTTLVIHLGFAIAIVVLGLTVGLWFVSNKLVISEERMDAAMFAYHMSIWASVFSLLIVPFNAAIIAHEKMSIYAYMSIFEVCAKLAICYALTTGSYDKLTVYALLYLAVQFLTFLLYYLYCSKVFDEVRLSFKYNKKISKDLLGFSGWGLFAQVGMALNGQGVLILLNMFFTPAIVAARSISIQVNMAATQFVGNFRVAVNPQIVKKLASGDKSGSHALLLLSTKYSYYLMLIICLPLIFLTKPVLHIWLKEVPDYSVVFVQFILVQSLFQVFDTSFYTALYAMGRLKENALLSPTIGIIQFPIVYIFFKFGFSPLALSWAGLITVVLLGTIIKPILITKIAEYTWSDIWGVFWPCIKVTVSSIPVPLYFYMKIDIMTPIGLCSILLVSVLCVAISSWYLGIEKQNRRRLISWIFSKIKINI